MRSILENIEDNLIDGTETVRVINSISNNYCCKVIRVIETIKKTLDNGGICISSKERDLSEIWCSCIFKEKELITKNINNIPEIIDECAIYDDINNILRYYRSNNISDNYKYCIRQLLRIIYNNQTILEKLNNNISDKFISADNHEVKLNIIDEQINNDILPFINNDNDNDIKNIVLDVFWNKQNSELVCIKINIPFAFKVHYDNSSIPPIEHEGRLKLEFYRRKNPLIELK